jgi:hypothetical protein
VGLRLSCFDGETTAAMLKDPTLCCELFSASAMGPGMVMIERRLARHLVNALLGRTDAVIAGPLSRVERGLLAGLLATSLAKLELSIGVQVGATEVGDVGREGLCVQVSVSLPGEEGRVWLCTNAAALERCWRVSRLSQKSPPTALRLELARTDLHKDEVLATSDGDVVVFDESSALSPSSPWPLQVCYGDRRIAVRLDPDGSVHRDEQFSVTSRIRRPGMAGDGRVEIIAEMAHPGAWQEEPSSVRSGGPPGDGVLLRMGDVDWAEGRLCEMDGRLAVRITRTFAC